MVILKSFCGFSMKHVCLVLGALTIVVACVGFGRIIWMSVGSGHTGITSYTVLLILVNPIYILVLGAGINLVVGSIRGYRGRRYLKVGAVLVAVCILLELASVGLCISEASNGEVVTVILVQLVFAGFDILYFVLVILCAVSLTQLLIKEGPDGPLSKQLKKKSTRKQRKQSTDTNQSSRRQSTRKDSEASVSHDPNPLPHQLPKRPSHSRPPTTHSSAKNERKHSTDKSDPPYKKRERKHSSDRKENVSVHSKPESYQLPRQQSNDSNVYSYDGLITSQKEPKRPHAAGRKSSSSKMSDPNAQQSAGYNSIAYPTSEQNSPAYFIANKKQTDSGTNSTPSVQSHSSSTGSNTGAQQSPGYNSLAYPTPTQNSSSYFDANKKQKKKDADNSKYAPSVMSEPSSTHSHLDERQLPEYQSLPYPSSAQPSNTIASHKKNPGYAESVLSQPEAYHLPEQKSVAYPST